MLNRNEIYLIIGLVVLLFVIFYIRKGNIFKSNIPRKYRSPIENKNITFKKVHIVIDDNIIDKGDIFEIIDPLWSSVKTYEGEEIYSYSLKDFSTSQKYVCAICWYRAEVNNGGHDQFYFNSTGIVWEDALNGLDEIGLIDFKNILKESIQRMGGSPSKYWIERQKQLDELNPNFDDLDKKFYDLEIITNVNSVILEYIKKNRESFYFDGFVNKASLKKSKS